MSDDEFSAETREIRWDDRSHIIKALQEQVQALLCYKNDYEQMQKRCRIAEQALQLRETEVKLKFDEMEEIMTSITEENQELKERLAKGIHRQNAQIPSHEEDTENTYYEKYQKWKTKYAALLNSKISDDQPVDDTTLKTACDKLQQENRELRDEIRLQKDQIQKLTAHLKTNMTESKGSTKSVVDFQKKYEKVKAENELLKQENEKLVDKSKQKSSLLKHTRTQQEKQRKARQQAQSSLEAELEKERAKNKQADANMTQLANNLSIERETAKKLRSKYNQMKKGYEETIQKLEGKISQFERHLYQANKETNHERSNTSRLQVTVDDLQQEKIALELKVAENKKVKSANAQLQSVVSALEEKNRDLEEAVQDAHNELESVKSSVRVTAVKTLSPDAIEWDLNECLEGFLGLSASVKAANDKISDLDVANANLQKKVKKLVGQVALQKKIIQEKNDALSCGMPDSSDHGGISETASEVNFAPQIVLKQMPDPFESINEIRHRAARRMGKLYFQLYDDVSGLIRSVNPPQDPENEANDKGPSFRACIMTVICLKRLLVFKKNDELENQSILAYTGSTFRKQESNVKDLTESIVEKLERSRESTTSHSLLAKAHSELAERNRQLEKQARNLREELRTERDHVKHMETELEFTKSRCETLIDPRQYHDLERRCEDLTSQKKGLEHQLGCLKVEMANLLESTDCGMNKVTEVQLENTELVQENEEYRQHILNLEHELAETKIALNNKIREYLAIERKLMKQNEKCVIIKDKLPATYHIMAGKSDPEAPDGRFLSEDIRCGLDRMRHRIIQARNDPLI